ncbi:MAG: hypothetical protein ACHP79_02965, partial [Terriglobales bacterium]
MTRSIFAPAFTPGDGYIDYLARRTQKIPDGVNRPSFLDLEFIHPFPVGDVLLCKYKRPKVGYVPGNIDCSQINIG